MLNQEERVKAEGLLNQALEQKPAPEVKKEEKPVEQKKEDQNGKQPEKKEDVAPTKIVIDGKEYNPEEVKERLTKLQEVELIEKKHGDIREIYKEFTKRSQKLAELEKSGDIKKEEIQKKEEDLKKVDKKIKEYDDEAKKLREEAENKLGLATKEEVEKALQEIEAAKKELLDMKENFKTELTDLRSFKEEKVKEEEKQQLKKTNEDLVRMESEFPFVKRNDVIDYMIEESKKGNVLTVEEAVKRKYTDEIIEFKVKKSTSNVPDTDASKGGKPNEKEEDNTISFRDGHQSLFEKGMKVFETSLNKLKM